MVKIKIGKRKEFTSQTKEHGVRRDTRVFKRLLARLNQLERFRKTNTLEYKYLRKIWDDKK